MKQRAMERLMGVEGRRPARPVRPPRPHRCGHRRPCHHPPRRWRWPARRDAGQEPGNRHAAQGRYGALDRARAGFGAEFARCRRTRTSDQELRIVEVEFIGELPKDEQGRPKSFRRGISTYPSLGDVVFAGQQGANSPRPMPAIPRPRSASAISSRTARSRPWSRSTSCWASISPCSAPPAPANHAPWR